MKLLLTGLFLILTFFSSLALDTSDYRFHTMPETSYYGGIHCVAKDSIGRIWFSGYDALFMYNGNSFIQMNDRVTSLLPGSYWSYGQVVTSSSKQLYVSTNHGLLDYNYQTNKFRILLKGNIGSIAPSNDGTLWLIRNDKVEAFHPGQIPKLVFYPLPSGMSVSALICTKKHVYMASAGNLYRLDPKFKKYNYFTCVTGIVKDVVEHNESVYILTHMNGLYECDAKGRVVKHYNLSQENDKSAGAKKLYIDSFNIVWIATQSGLFLLDPRTKEIRLLRTNLYNKYSLPNNSVWSIFPDPDGGVWIGAYGGKLAYMTFFDNYIDSYKATPGGLDHPIVSCFEEDEDGNLWVGTEGGGLNYWDRNTGHFSYYTQENNTGITSNMIKRLQYDSERNLLLSAFNGGMEKFDVRQGHFIDMQMRDPHTQQQLNIYDFVMESDSGIWMTDPDSELMYKDKRNGIIKAVSFLNDNGKPVKMHIETLFHSKGNKLWLVSHQGVYVVDVSTRRILKHYYIKDAPYAANNLCSYCITSESEIWFGTRGGGVNRLGKDGRYVNFNERNGFLGNTVFGILEDNSSKDIWFSTNDGLYYYDYRSKKMTKSLIDNLNLCGAFYVRSCYKTSQGEMLFGGTDGFIIFTPNKIKYNKQKPKVFFTDLFINNKKVVPNTEDAPLSKDISTMSYHVNHSNKILLSYNQSNIEICVSANSYLQSGKNQFAYRMLGLSNQWNVLPRRQKSIQFFNLPAGTYIFEVKAANNDGLWGDEVSSLYFEVQPSPFLSIWAYIIYSLLLMCLVYFIWRYFVNKKIFKHKLEMEKIKEQNMQKLTQARINFFTNISHDLKTPLSLIIDPLKQLKTFLPDAQSSDAKTYVNLIEKNTNRIQRMISQLLQFREIESQKITFNLQPGDLIHYIGDIFSLFELYANKKGLETDLQSDMNSFYTLFDHDAIEKIFTNLFSNAIKYTSERGFWGVKISKTTQDEVEKLTLERKDQVEYISITVTNTGTEIPDDKKDEIFESFKRLTSGRPALEDSTGLGLSIVKELVNSLDGRIILNSDNSRVSFTVILPFPLNIERTNSDVISYEYTISEIDNVLAEAEEDTDLHSKRNRKAYSIVVIEDDFSLRTYMEQRLSEYYNVYTTTNGVEGIAKVKKVCPQIVITDLKMPEADGFDVCHILRSNIQTSHIPIIVLSGLGQNMQNKIKALEKGANVFIDKPLDMEFLLKQVNNLIKNQNELKELYSKKYIAEPSRVTISPIDEELLKRAMEQIEKNISNCDYNVESFVSDMGIGRTLLYQKIYDIVGMSIKEFIMDVRLKRSAQLLKESDLTISEIANQTGFINPKYFSICFKKHFELTPSEFKKKS